jgi:poly(hydroxyalkanoate) depolymerase family esterase
MRKRIRQPFSGRAFQRTLKAMTRFAMRAGAKVMSQTMRQGRPKPAKKAAPKAVVALGAARRTGFVAGTAGGLRYRLFKPAAVRRSDRLPLMVMLHGCGQDALSFAASTRMNLVAARERFVVLYPEQNRISNLQGCWNWHQTRTGKAQSEADALAAAIDKVCLSQPIDPARIALAGLSAGAGMAALLATREPGRFRAVAMHSGIAPGVAHSSLTALSAMRGSRTAAPLPSLAHDAHLPALLVIQGSADPVIAPSNGADAARLWAASEGAKPGRPRTVRRGERYPATLTDYRAQGRLVATLCEIAGLGHAWSGGIARQPYSDPKGPDASRMIWAFASKQFEIPSPALLREPQAGPANPITMNFIAK